MDTAQLEDTLRSAGLRVTRGRLAVLSALSDRPHSDAETVLAAVQPALPGTSIQNIHNVLGDLTLTRMVRRIEPAHSPALYERRIGDNHHVVCTLCSTVADVDCVVGHAPCLRLSEAAGFAVDTAEVTFWRLCPSCQESTAATPSRSE
ncbi:Fur family transcriptional regulator [Leifsonia xyli subsp. xyli]|uniref:Ferric uptake regulator, Fur family n=2 Tax=Leifsonia xyli subsp. xyli TaxID=59736 RepID=Q6AH34_LEIXX|nr:transcriptional repressor [Leifsonia xyli]AAT88311.1 ferric uptake regulator, Fur family [Leifsonia xyli subsp. xyli str. CTCB07]ODA89752.1 Fur family transcriptional regulator [Leifsonia xyli subsp. xyli]